MVLQCLIACLFCLFLSSCKKQDIKQIKPIVTVENQNIKVNIKSNNIQQEAMFLDVPIPLYDEQIISTPSYQESDSHVFAYKSSLSVSQLIHFFNTQMERYGWQHIVSFKSDEIIMNFQNPIRFCTIIIKKLDDSSSQTLFFIYMKKDEHNSMLADK